MSNGVRSVRKGLGWVGGMLLAACGTAAPKPAAVEAAARRGDSGIVDADAADAWLAEARAHLDPRRPSAGQDPQRAREAARRAVRAMPRPDAGAWATLGTACYVNGDLRGAIEAYEQALEAPGLGCRDELEAWLREIRAEAAMR